METHRQRMLRGELYDATDPQLAAARQRARRLMAALNGSDPADTTARASILAALFGSVGVDVCIEPPFFCDYGSNIHLGAQVFMNFNCVILDPAEVHIGDGVLFGPNVQLYTATHPLDHATRSRGLESALPIRVGVGAWLGGGCILLPGSVVGERSVIGAGSVVSGSIPDDVLAVGNPCRIIRRLN